VSRRVLDIFRSAWARWTPNHVRSVAWRTRVWIHTLPYRGIGRRCNVCGRQSRVFARAGVMRRPDACCVFCGSLERHRFLWRYLDGTVAGSGPSRVALHFAPEPCLVSRLGALIGPGYVTADIERSRVRVQLDISQLPFRDDSFDMLICSHVLEHVQDDRRAIRELAIVLRPTGRAIVIVPVNRDQTVEDPSVTDPAERLRLFGQVDHVRAYGPDVVSRFVEAGFSVTLVRPPDILSNQGIQDLRIPADCEPLFVLGHETAGRQATTVT